VAWRQASFVLLAAQNPAEMIGGRRKPSQDYLAG
jgi:hypothetical protein